MPAPPLTHHEILGLVEPFTRRGRHVDLAASDRAARRLLFRPVDLEGDLRDTLALLCEPDASFTLVRTLRRPDGLEATLQGRGPRPDALLAAVEAVAPAQLFRSGEGFAIARSYGAGTVDGSAVAWTLAQGLVHTDGLSLVLNVPPGRGSAADIALHPTGGWLPDLPEDLLAVLGWDWARLVRSDDGWTSKRRLRGGEARRTRQAEAALDRVAQHLAQVLAEAPVRFHQRHLLARWGVVFRRAIPSLTALALIATALLLPHFTDPRLSGVWMALHYLPIAVLALSFTLQELPRFEIPPLPRRPRAARWQTEPVAERER